MKFKINDLMISALPAAGAASADAIACGGCTGCSSCTGCTGCTGCTNCSVCTSATCVRTLSFYCGATTSPLSVNDLAVYRTHLQQTLAMVETSLATAEANESAREPKSIEELEMLESQLQAALDSVRERKKLFQK